MNLINPFASDYEYIDSETSDGDEASEDSIVIIIITTVFVAVLIIGIGCFCILRKHRQQLRDEIGPLNNGEDAF